MPLHGREWYLSEVGLKEALFNDRRGECDILILLSVNVLWLLSAILEPFMPEIAAQMQLQANTPARAIPAGFALDMLPGHKTGQPFHLFGRIQLDQAAAWSRAF